MKAPVIILILCFTVCNCSLAQDSTRVGSPLAVFVMPCQLLPIGFAGGFTVGTEFPLYKRFSLSVEGGMFYDPGYMVKAIAKYYVSIVPIDSKAQNAVYVALEYAYKKQEYIAEDRGKNSSYGPSETEINYSVYKFANTFILKCGSVSTKKHLYFDGYFGLGIRYRVVQNDLLPAKEKELFYWNDGFIDQATNATCRGFAPALSLGIKIGYRYK